jgi:hypothetical protein
MKMQRIDEMGVANPQKSKKFSRVGFPLEDYGIALQWSRLYWKNKNASELAAQIDAAVTADKIALIAHIKLAMMMGINYSFPDYLVDHVDGTFVLPIKALVNADGANIPPGPNGEIYDPLVHNHYLASAGVTNSFLAALVETVVEHEADGQCTVWINRADLPAVSALADFKALVETHVIRANNQEYGDGVLDPIPVNNRLVGFFRGSEVWVKPYMLQGYIWSFMENTKKPAVVMRVRGTQPNGGPEAEGAGELGIAYEDEKFPLYGKEWRREFGMGIYYRTSAAVGYINGSTYVMPSPALLGL